MPDPCLILGDSVALGVSWYAPDCTVIAGAGLSTSDFVRDHLGEVRPTAHALISLGANDGHHLQSAYFRLIRERLHTTKVIWLLPANNDGVRIYLTGLAAEFGDRTIDLRGGPLAPDRIHPSRAHYRAIAEEFR